MVSVNSLSGGVLLIASNLRERLETAAEMIQEVDARLILEDAKKDIDALIGLAKRAVEAEKN